MKKMKRALYIYDDNDAEEFSSQEKYKPQTTSFGEYMLLQNT